MSSYESHVTLPELTHAAAGSVTDRKKKKKDKNCGDTKFVVDASGLTFQLGPQNFDTSRPPRFVAFSLSPTVLYLRPVAMIIHSSEVVAVGFKLQEVLPA